MIRWTGELTCRWQADSKQTAGRLTKCHEWSSTVMLSLMFSDGHRSGYHYEIGLREWNRESERESATEGGGADLHYEMLNCLLNIRT